MNQINLFRLALVTMLSTSPVIADTNVITVNQVQFEKLMQSIKTHSASINAYFATPVTNVVTETASEADQTDKSAYSVVPKPTLAVQKEALPIIATTPKKAGISTPLLTKEKTETTQEPELVRETVPEIAHIAAPNHENNQNELSWNPPPRPLTSKRSKLFFTHETN